MARSFARVVTMKESVEFLRRYRAKTTPERRALDIVTIAIFFLGFAGQGVRNIVGFYGSSVVMVTLFVALAYLMHLNQIRFTQAAYPLATLLFVMWCALSVIWSQYPHYSAMFALVTIGVTLTGLAISACYTFTETANLLIVSFKVILIVSYALELFTALIWKQRLAPIPMIRAGEYVPDMSYWVYGDLFNGGPIQGFPGNRNPLAFIALLLILCLLVKWMSTYKNTTSTIIWLIISIVTITLTRSGTVTVAVIICMAIAMSFGLVKSVTRPHRPALISLITSLTLTGAVIALFNRLAITDFLGRSPDFSGRGDIWKALVPMWSQHPILGWGFTIGYQGDVPVFSNFIRRGDGTPTTQAHNSFIEALFQTGIIGVSILSVAVATVFFGTFIYAVRHVDESRRVVMPAMIASALIIQSTVESRLLFEGNWILFVILAAWVAKKQPFASLFAKYGPFKRLANWSLSRGQGMMNP